VRREAGGIKGTGVRRPGVEGPRTVAAAGLLRRRGCRRTVRLWDLWDLRDLWGLWGLRG